MLTEQISCSCYLHSISMSCMDSLILQLLQMFFDGRNAGWNTDCYSRQWMQSGNYTQILLKIRILIQNEHHFSNWFYHEIFRFVLFQKENKYLVIFHICILLKIGSEMKIVGVNMWKSIWNLNKQTFGCLFVWWCLTPRSTICQLYRGAQFYCWGKYEYPEKNHRPAASNWQTLSHNVVHLALIEIRTHNLSGDRHWLHWQL